MDLRYSARIPNVNEATGVENDEIRPLLQRLYLAGSLSESNRGHSDDAEVVASYFW